MRVADSGPPQEEVIEYHLRGARLEWDAMNGVDGVGVVAEVLENRARDGDSAPANKCVEPPIAGLEAEIRAAHAERAGLARAGGAAKGDSAHDRRGRVRHRCHCDRRIL